MKMSISFRKATKQTSISHNNRLIDDEKKNNAWHKHIDFSKSAENVYLEQTPIKDKYQELFGEAVEEYNSKQNRADRKIKDYYSKVLKNKSLEPQREFLIQVGTNNDFNTVNAEGNATGLTEAQAEANKKMANEILIKYYKSFEERNPNLKIYNAVIHNDEMSPHLHLNVVPVAEGYKKGVNKQPSFNKALKQQGVAYDDDNNRALWVNFRNQEVNSMSDIMLDYNIEREVVGTNEYDYNIHDFKSVKKAEYNDIDVLKIENQRLKNENSALRKEFLEIEHSLGLYRKMGFSNDRAEKAFENAENIVRSPVSLRDEAIALVQKNLNGSEQYSPEAWIKEADKISRKTGLSDVALKHIYNNHKAEIDEFEKDFNKSTGLNLRKQYKGDERQIIDLALRSRAGTLKEDIENNKNSPVPERPIERQEMDLL